MLPWERPDGSTCDFCNIDTDRAPLVKDYCPVHQMVAELPDGRRFVDGPVWGACQSCADLIDASNWPRLVRRCIEGIMAAYPDQFPDTVATRITLGFKLRVTFYGVFGERFRCYNTAKSPEHVPHN
jgi:hypothetical protein